jgi:hypothetical protein
MRFLNFTYFACLAKSLRMDRTMDGLAYESSLFFFCCMIVLLVIQSIYTCIYVPLIGRTGKPETVNSAIYMQL